VLLLVLYIEVEGVPLCVGIGGCMGGVDGGPVMGGGIVIGYGC
jgi:hypothetical protein